MVIVLLLWSTTKADRGKMNKTHAGGRGGEKKKGVGNVDSLFISRIKELAKIAVPNWHCKETKYLAVLTVLLVLRTQMSIWLADVNGKVVKAIVDKNFKKFCYRVSASSPTNAFYRFFT